MNRNAEYNGGNNGNGDCKSFFFNNFKVRIRINVPIVVYFWTSN